MSNWNTQTLTELIIKLKMISAFSKVMERNFVVFEKVHGNFWYYSFMVRTLFSLYHLVDTHIFVIHLFLLKQPTCHILYRTLLYVKVSDTIQSYFVLGYSDSSLNIKVLVTFSRLFKGTFILRSFGVSHSASCSFDET